MIVADLPEALKGCPLYQGGPVQPSALSFLALRQLPLRGQCDAEPESGPFAGCPGGHRRLVFSDAKDQDIRGLMPAGVRGQLEDEMKRKAWLTHPASLELVFRHPPEQLWQTILRQKGWKYSLLAQMPEDPSLN